MTGLVARLAAALHSQRERWVLWTPVPLALGAGGYFSLPSEPPAWAGAAGAAFLALLPALFYRNKAALLAWLPFFLVALGFAAAQLRTWSVAAPMLERKSYPLIIEGRVDAVEPIAQAYRLVVSAPRYTEIRYPEKTPPQETLPKKLRIKLKKSDVPPQPGDLVRLRAILLPISPPVAPEAYDFRRHMFFQGIGATGFAISDVEVLAKGKDGFFFASLRRTLGERIRAAIGRGDASAITTALLYGEDRDISKETYDKLRTAGLAHLIAISGLQITLVTGFFFFLVRAALAAIPYVALRWPVKKIAAFAALGAAVFYMMLIGESVSAERSVIMVCVVMLAIMLDRDPLTLRTAAFAAAAMLLFQPESLFSAGFQLSFAAVVALIAFYEAVKERWTEVYRESGWLARAGLWLGGSMATTLVATLATAPVSLFHFLRTPLLPGLVANLIAMPLSSFITMPAAILGCVLMPLGLEALPLRVAAWSVEAIIAVSDFLSRWPYAVYKVEAWPQGVFVMMVFGGLWICLWRGGLRWFGALPLLAGLALIPQTPRADVLVSASGKLFAVRGKEGALLFSSARAEKFTREIWLARESNGGYGTWPQGGEPAADMPVACDAEACLYRRGGHTVSFVKSPLALARDCAAADVVVSSLYIRPEQCAAPVLIAKHALHPGGAHALYFGENGVVTVRSVYTKGGRRPWKG
jgi:competence protein ComEC